MTDQEINEAVARELGWKKDPDHGNLWTRGYLADLQFLHPLPNYCHSIEAAWEIVEKLKREDTGIRIHFDYEQWHVDFDHEDFWQYTEGADTAPMAICLAFLKLP